MKAIFLTLGFIFIVSCSYSQNIWKVFSEKNFTMKYPDSWTNKNNNGMVLFASPKVNSSDGFQENVNLMTQDLNSSPMNLEEYTNLTKKQVVDNLGASSIISLKSIVIAGYAAKEFVYNMNYQGRSLKLKQIWFIKNNVAYLFTFTALPSTFNDYESTATTIIMSFKFV